MEEEEKKTGLMIINKPFGWPSMKVIRKIRKLTGVKKVGHAGTLDPLATGVLLVCIGRDYTKRISEFMDLEKEYVAEIDLSAFSDTDDREGKISLVDIKTPPTKKEIQKKLATFVGKQLQIPPKFSAALVEGKRAYKLARANKEFELKAKEIEIHEIQILDYTWPKLKIKIACGKGTYIRSLARDLGKKLKTGGYLTGLTRTAIGKYRIENAHNPEKLSEIKPEMITILNLETAITT